MRDINWCKCDHTTDVYYVPDGKKDDCEKHHWRCIECDGIVQIG